MVMGRSYGLNLGQKVVQENISWFLQKLQNKNKKTEEKMERRPI